MVDSEFEPKQSGSRFLAHRYGSVCSQENKSVKYTIDELPERWMGEARGGTYE